MRIKNIIAAMLLIVAITGCTQGNENSEQNAGQNTGQNADQNADQNVDQDTDQNVGQNNAVDGDEQEEEQSIEERAEQTIEALKNKDMQKLSEIADPNQGVLFSPYAYVDKEDNLIFTAAQIKDLLADETQYMWGNYDGSGEPIQLTFAQYYDEFVYDEDFANAEQISYNERIGLGNSIDNTSEVYPNATIVEYHFSGFEEQYDGMDWKSLRLVFEETEGVWYLVAVIHDQWTI